jgi:cytochrome P450
VLKVMDSPDVTALLEELATPAGREDPYPRYERLRAISPVARAADGALVVTCYADCTTAVRDPRLGQLPPDVLAMAGYPDWAAHPALRLLFTSLLMLNPPDHTRLRRLVSGTFTARRVQALRPAIARMVNDLLDGMSGTVDFVTAFAFQLPVNVIGELLGVPQPDRAQFQSLVRDWAQVLEALHPSALRRADAAATTIRDYLSRLAAERRREPGTDLLSALVSAHEAGHHLSEDELLTTTALLFAAGFETTTNLLTNSLVALLSNPGQLRLLREQPALIQPAVEELLRFDSPVQIVSRVTTAPVELGGRTVPAGEHVVAYLGAGNRDPDRFTDPNRLDLGRQDNAPLSFGGGSHYCLGAPLARLEAQLALPALLRRFPRLSQTGEPQRRDSLSIRGFTRLPVATG